MTHPSPSPPSAWPSFSIDYRFGGSSYAIEVRNADGTSRDETEVTVDGVSVADGWITLSDDGQRHVVSIVLGVGQLAAR